MILWARSSLSFDTNFRVKFLVWSWYSQFIQIDYEIIIEESHYYTKPILTPDFLSMQITRELLRRSFHFSIIWVRLLRRANYLSIQCLIFERLSWGLAYTFLAMSDFRAGVLRRTDYSPCIFLCLPLQYQSFECFSWGEGFLLGLLLYQIQLLRGSWPEDSTIRRSSCETFLLTIFWNLHTPFYLVVLSLLNLCFVIAFSIFFCRFLYELYLFCILG